MDIRSTFIVILIAIAFLGIVIWWLIAWGKKEVTNEFEYHMFYIWLKDCIENYSIHRDNYSFLQSKLLELSGLKHKDKEKTDGLIAQFYRRFERFAKDEIGRDEFDSGSVFQENDVF